MEECVKFPFNMLKKYRQDLIYQFISMLRQQENLINSFARYPRGEYEGFAEKINDDNWIPDFGPSFSIQSGGSPQLKNILIAYNVNLNTDDKIQQIV